MSEERCGLCRFWPRYPYAEANDTEHGISGSESSECRRRAPKASDDGLPQPNYPWVHRAHWCGEFEGRRPSPSTKSEDLQ